MMTTVTNQGFYLTTKQIAMQQECSERHIRDIMHEMEKLIGIRYEPEDILEDSKMINQYALYDYLKYRKALKDPAASRQVPKFDHAKWAETCPIVERWRI